MNSSAPNSSWRRETRSATVKLDKHAKKKTSEKTMPRKNFAPVAVSHVSG